MADVIVMPSRFAADGMPTDGLIKILDQKTGRSGNVPLSSYPHVTALLGTLFPEDETVSADAPSENKEDEEAPSPEKAELKVAIAPAAKPERVKKTATKRKAASKPAEVADAEVAPSAKKTKKVVSKRTTKKVPTKSGIDLQVIEGKGFSLVPAGDRRAAYDIVRSNGSNAGQVIVRDNGSLVVRPTPGSGFEEQEYTNMIGAKARVFVITR